MSVRQDILLEVRWYWHKLAAIGSCLYQITVVAFFENHTRIGVFIFRSRVGLTSSPDKQMSARQKVLRFVGNVIWVRSWLWVALLCKYYFLMLLVSIRAFVLAIRSTLQKSSAGGFMVVHRHRVIVVHNLMFDFLIFLWLFFEFDVGIIGLRLLCRWWVHRHYFFVVFPMILLKL